MRWCTAFEGCGLRAKCGNRGDRTRLQWRLGCRVVVSYPQPEGRGARAKGETLGKLFRGLMKKVVRGSEVTTGYGRVE